MPVTLVSQVTDGATKYLGEKATLLAPQGALVVVVFLDISKPMLCYGVSLLSLKSMCITSLGQIEKEESQIRLAQPATRESMRLVSLSSSSRSAE